MAEMAASLEITFQPRLFLRQNVVRKSIRIHILAMPRAWMPSFVVVVLTAAGVHAGADPKYSRLVVPNVPDLTIKTRQTADLPQSTIFTHILYFKGAWQRRELHLQLLSILPIL